MNELGLSQRGCSSGQSEAELRNAREILATNLRGMRLEKRWSQELLSLESGLHRTFVAHVEGGSRNISLDNLERLATALSVPPYVLLQPNRTSSF